MTVLPSTMELQDLTRLAKKAQGLEQLILQQEEETKARKAELRTLYELEIPEIMDLLDMKAFTMQDGRQLVVEPVVEGSIPVANRVEAFAWLREHKYDGIIKNEVSVSLGKGQDSIAAEAVKTLEALGLTVDQKESVHAGTLKSWAKDIISQGRHLPLELLGIFVGRRAKIKDPKKKKGAVED